MEDFAGKYFLVPCNRNPHFTGRDDFLIQLTEMLSQTKPKQYNHRVAIYGMGGIGKTQLAIEYIHRYKARYTGIYWISGVDQAALLSGFQDIATVTGCVPINADLSPAEVARAVLSWLASVDGWLLVMDNLDDISVVDGYLPIMKEGGHTLITTRNPEKSHPDSIIPTLRNCFARVFRTSK